MIKITVLLVSILIIGCKESKVSNTSYYTNYCKDKDKIAKFVLDCAKAANPMSDEEGEDLVRGCYDTATDLYCSDLMLCKVTVQDSGVYYYVSDKIDCNEASKIYAEKVKEYDLGR